MKNHTNHRLNKKSQNSKPHFRANGPILSLALRPGLLMLLVILSLLGTLTINSLAQLDSASATSITLSIPNSLSLDINGASPSGTFAKSSPATISTKTDSTTGYTLSIKSKDSVDSNCLKLDSNSNSNSSKINSISSSMSEEEFRSSAPMNTWGYQPDIFNGTANSNFLPGPANTESVIDKTKTANNVLGSNYNIVLAAKVNTDLPAGTYKNTYTLTATANAVTYSVHYNNLESSTGGPSPNPQTGQTDGNTFKLSNQRPTKAGFIFKGYCMLQPKDDGSCETAIFQPGDTFVIYCNENDIELWTMWSPSLQDFNCGTLSITEQTIQLEDSRDGITYNVAKLKDNRCWMTDNLRIQNYELTTTDSDVASNYTLPASDKDGFSNFDKSNVYIDSIYGGYYSYLAATAGEGSTSDKSSGDILHSICPKGWKLPTRSEFQALITALGGNIPSAAKTLQASPNNFQKGGDYIDGSPADMKSFGRYWSASNYSNYEAYYLLFNDSSISPDNMYYKQRGLSIRCIARQ